MTWRRRLSLARLWLHMHALPVGLALGAVVVVALCLIIYLPGEKPTAYEGTVEGFGFRDDEALGRLPTLRVKLDKGAMPVDVSIPRGVICNEGDRITVFHRGGLRGYASDVTGCRRPTLPEGQSPR